MGSVMPMAADDGTPCLIFTGAADQPCALDLARYNRVVFGENSMTAVNTKDPSDKVELLYSAYHHLEVGTAQASGIGGVEAPAFALSYDAENQALKLEGSDAESKFAVGVFNVGGVLVCHTELRPGESASLANLASGVYIAVAAGEQGAQKIKFVK